MSYTTRCPACGTMFKVVPDQLKISDGWVRCGHCADVFDATLYLETWVPPVPVAASPPAEPPVPEQQHVPNPAALEESETQAFPPEPAIEPEPEPLPVPEWPADSLVVPLPLEGAPAVTEPVAFEALLPEPPLEPELPMPAAPPVGFTTESDDWLVSPESVSDSRAQEQEAQAVWQAPVSAPPPPSAWHVDQDSPAVITTDVVDPVAERPLPGLVNASSEPSARSPDPDFQRELERFAADSSGAARSLGEDEPVPAPALTGWSAAVDESGRADQDEPGFVRQARRMAFWHSPGVRTALGVLSLLLVLLLVGQWTYRERNQLAASHPDLAPVLIRLCEPLGCELGPLRRIEAVVIDSSTLVRRLGNFYSFDLVLKNTATMPVAMPALELSLTDTRDSVIARRVFRPEEMPGAPALLAARGSLPLSLRLSISDVGAVPMAGYRALVFYP